MRNDGVIPARRYLVALALALSVTAPVQARMVTDSAGRNVELPDRIVRVFAAGPPAAVLLYMEKPDAMMGWVRAPRDIDKPFLLPSVRDLPELGRLTGKGDTINPETLLEAKPDLILDLGSTSKTYVSLAAHIQEQTGIPYVLLDGRFSATVATLKRAGEILGVPKRGETLAKAAQAILNETDRVIASLPAGKRPRVYLARGPEGLETGTRGSINTEIIEGAGAINVVEGFDDHGGIVDTSREQVLAWAPDTIITVDRGFAASAPDSPEWQTVPAIKQKRLFLAPDTPFGFTDMPPSVNRLAGLIWLNHVLYPGQDSGDLKTELRDFYRTFYQVTPSDTQLDAFARSAISPR